MIDEAAAFSLACRPFGPALAGPAAATYSATSRRRSLRFVTRSRSTGACAGEDSEGVVRRFVTAAVRSSVPLSHCLLRSLYHRARSLAAGGFGRRTLPFSSRRIAPLAPSGFDHAIRPHAAQHVGPRRHAASLAARSITPFAISPFITSIGSLRITASVTSSSPPRRAPSPAAAIGASTVLDRLRRMPASMGKAAVHPLRDRCARTARFQSHRPGHHALCLASRSSSRTPHIRIGAFSEQPGRASM